MLCVILYNSYMQETGRAGRDGQPSDCILYYSYQDKKKIEFLLDNALRDGSITYQHKQYQSKKLNEMIDFCENNVYVKQYNYDRHYDLAIYIYYNTVTLTLCFNIILTI